MRKRLGVLMTLAVAGTCVIAAAKEKKKPVLPDYVLQAQTVFVLIDPMAGTSVEDPQGNKTAQDDVEKALMNWGRLRPVISMAEADLVIVVRKGGKNAMHPTVEGEPTNDRPVIVQPNDNGIRIGAQQGRSPDVVQMGGPTGQKPGLGTEVGPTEDLFMVYKAEKDVPLQGAPIWTYKAKNGLKSPQVPAVGEFKKAVDEAVKEQEARQKQQQQQGQQSQKKCNP